MKKIVLFCRVSTDRQSYDEQLEDLVKFAKSRGINDDEMLIIEGAGASAIKLNEAYLDMINKVQEAIKQNPGIEAVYFLNSKEDQEFLINFANKNNLLVTAGSDCHGDFVNDKRHGDIGDMYLDEIYINALLDKLQI